MGRICPTRIMKRKLAVDIDNTIWDLITPWIKLYNYYYDDNIQYSDIVEYDFFNIAKKATKDQIFKLLSIQGFWNLVEPYEYSVEYLDKLNNEYDLYIVTSTSYRIAKEKLDRFFKLFPFINDSQLILTHNKDLINVDIIVDDYPKQLINKNCIKFLIDSPYNKDVSDTTIIRVDNLKDVYNCLHELN